MSANRRNLEYKLAPAMHLAKCFPRIGDLTQRSHNTREVRLLKLLIRYSNFLWSGSLFVHNINSYP